MEDILFNIAIGNEVDLTIVDDDKFNKKVAKNRILDSVLKWNGNLVINGEIWKDKKIRLEKVLLEFKKVITIMRKKEIQFLNLKGLAMYKYYPPDIPRQSHDFDFLIKDIDTYWVVHDILIENEYYYHYHPMFTVINGEIVGLIKYCKVIDNQTKIYIELNIGKFIIAEVSWFGNSDLWDNSQIYTYNGIDLNIPSDNFNLMILVIETSDRKKFRLRDIIDFYFLEKQGKLDWDYIYSTLKDGYLISILKKLKLNCEYLINKDTSLINKKVKSIKREFTHILPYIMKDKSRFRKTFYRYLKLIGEQFVQNDKFLNVFQHTDKFMDPKRRFYTGIVTHFIPLNNNIKKKCEWLKYKKYNIVFTPIGTFLASNFAILDEDEEIDIYRLLLNMERDEIYYG